MALTVAFPIDLGHLAQTTLCWLKIGPSALNNALRGTARKTHVAKQDTQSAGQSAMEAILQSPGERNAGARGHFAHTYTAVPRDKGVRWALSSNLGAEPS